MSHNFITPNATRINCTFVLVNPFIGAMAGKTFPNSVFCASSYGDAVFFYWGVPAWYQPLRSLVILRVKSDGTFCWYINKAPSAVTLGNEYTSAIQLSDNTFLLGMQGYGQNVFIKVIVPSYFVPNGVVQFQPDSFALPGAPCGANVDTTKVWYGPNGKILVEYTQNFAEAFNLWARTALVYANGIETINAGQCGNFPQGSNPLVINTLKFYNPPPQGWLNAQYSIDNLGNQISRDIEYTDKLGNFLSVGSSNIKDGSLYCGGIGAFPQYTLSESYVYDSQNPVFNGFTFKANYQSNLSGGADFPCSAISNLYGATQIFNGPYFVEFFSPGSGYTNNGVYLSKSNVWIGTQQVSHITVNTPIAKPPAGILSPPPVVNSAQTSSLLNWHRPISTRGLFKT